MQGVLARIAESQIAGEILPWKMPFPEVALADPTQTRVFTDLPEPPTTMRRPHDGKNSSSYAASALAPGKMWLRRGLQAKILELKQ